MMCFFIDIYVNSFYIYCMPRTKEQNQKILDKRKQEIIHCAITIFTVKDYKSATVDDITKKLKISHGLFYHYFKNKDDLIKTIVDYANQTIMISFKKIAENYSGEEFLLQYFALFINLLKNRETALFIRFLNSVIKDEIEKPSRKRDTILEKFYNSIVYKNIKELSLEGKLIQNIESTFKLLIIITNGLCALAVEDKIKKANISPRSIVKSIVKISDEE